MPLSRSAITAYHDNVPSITVPLVKSNEFPTFSHQTNAFHMDPFERYNRRTDDKFEMKLLGILLMLCSSVVVGFLVFALIMNGCAQ